MDTNGPGPEAINALTILGKISDQILVLEMKQRHAVDEARKHGASWRMVGVALNTSTQAAWERYRPVEAPRPLPGQGSLPLGDE